MHAAQALAPQVTGTTRAIILLIIAAVVVFRKRLLYLLAYGMIILFTVIVVVGTVVLIHLLHGLLGLRMDVGRRAGDGTRPHQHP